jgi:hypothetical protein
MVTSVPPRFKTPAAPAADVDPAVRQARRVVGLYGDPDVTWSIVLRLDLAAPVSREAVARRVQSVFEAHPLLGRLPAVESLEASTLDRFANTPFEDRGPLVRLALDDAGRRVLVAAHHGAVDGLGLVGLAGRVLGLDLGTNARGVRRTGEEPGFLTGSLRRMGEIAFRPPERFRAPVRDAHGDHLLDSELPLLRRGTGALAWAGLRTLRAWNPRPVRLSQPVIALGVSRRSGLPSPDPDRDTAYTRLRVRSVRSQPDLADLLARTDPEPDFPVTDARGMGAVLTRLLGSRLGATMLVSNLGLVAGSDVTSASFWPVASGPHGVSLGLVSASGATTVTVRARRGWFGEDDAARLLELTRGHLEDQ